MYSGQGVELWCTVVTLSKSETYKETIKEKSNSGVPYSYEYWSAGTVPYRKRRMDVEIAHKDFTHLNLSRPKLDLMICTVPYSYSRVPLL